MKHIFMIGSKGIPARYGGFETFVEKLVENFNKKNIKFHVSCLAEDNNEFEYKNARCFNIKTPNVGAGKAVYYDIAALKRCIKYIKDNDMQNGIVYLMACRIGLFLFKYKKELKKRGFSLYVNPDGHEWKRDKWNWFIKQYWKISERFTVKNADLVVCDSKNIEKYVNEKYEKYKPKTTFIAYGADMIESTANDEAKFKKWAEENNIYPKKYYILVGRFVPENNYETMIREFMNSSTNKKFVLVTNVEHNKFYEELNSKTGFENDKRIKFVGTVYDQGLLHEIRKNAYGYLHGHEVGGTNPSLIEALSSTDLNLLLDVGFNSEVAQGGAIYWNKEEGNLAAAINKADKMPKKQIEALGNIAKKRIADRYNWKYVAQQYENIF